MSNACSDSGCPNGVPPQYMITISGISNGMFCTVCAGLNMSLVVSSASGIHNIPIMPSICTLNNWQVNISPGGGIGIMLQSDTPVEGSWSGTIDCLTGGTFSASTGTGQSCAYGGSVATIMPVAWPANTDPQSLPCIVPLSAGNGPGSNLGAGPLPWNLFMATIPTLLPQLADDVAIQTSLGAVGAPLCMFSPILTPPRIGYIPLLGATLGCPGLIGVPWPGMPGKPGLPGFPGGSPGFPGWPGLGGPGLVANPPVSSAPGPGPSSPQNPAPAPAGSRVPTPSVPMNMPSSPMMPAPIVGGGVSDIAPNMTIPQNLSPTHLCGPCGQCGG